MPAYGKAAPSGDSAMFSDAPEGSPAEEAHETPGEEKEEGGEQTALLPKTILAGKEFKPGEEVVLKIVAFHGDEVEVAYATGEEGKEGEGEAEEAPAAAPEGGGGGGDSGMGGMMY